MKDIVKLFCVVIAGVIGAAIPLTAVYWIWSACMAAVPISANAALIKILLSILLFMVGFGLTVWLVFIFAGLGVILVAALLD